jgi:hypothetical protein
VLAVARSLLEECPANIGICIVKSGRNSPGIGDFPWAGQGGFCYCRLACTVIHVRVKTLASEKSYNRW